MKTKTISILAFLGLLLTASVNAQITTIPYTADFEDSNAPFDAGVKLEDKYIGNVLRVNNTTAKAAFNIGGTAAYNIPANKEITIQYDGYHGWANDASTTTVQLVNSEDVVLVGYTYTHKATNVTDVVLGGQTATGFKSFFGQANCDTDKKSANGFDPNKQHFTKTDGYTPHVTFKVNSQGTVYFNFKYESNNGPIDATYTVTLKDVKMDLAQLVIVDKCSNEERSFGMDNLSIEEGAITLDIVEPVEPVVLPLYIDQLPYTADFEDSTAPFVGGTVKAATTIGNVLSVMNSEATAAFKIDDKDVYTVADNEEITIQFDALHGWAGDNTTSTIKLVNSDGIVLVGYTYKRPDNNVTDVNLGGQTAADFESFFAQANCETSGKSANGFTHSQHYSNKAGYTPRVTFKVHGLGAVSFNLKYTSNSGAVDKTFSANLEGVKMDLAKIVITDNCPNEDRCIGIDNLSITTAEKVYYKYTINYVDDAAKVVKTVEGAAEQGTKVAIEDEVIWVNGMKYNVISNDSETNPVANTNATVITVNVKEATKYNYTVNAVEGANILATLKTGNYYEGESVGYPFPHYFNVKGTLYKKDPNNQVYNGSFTLDADNKVVEAAYAATETSNVIYLKEAENIDVLTVCNEGTVADRCSFRAGGWSDKEVTLFKLAAGTYKLTAAAYGGAYTFKAGEKNVLEIANAGSWRETAGNEFTLTEETELTFVGGSGTAGSLDYLFIQSEDGDVVNAPAADNTIVSPSLALSDDAAPTLVAGTYNVTLSRSFVEGWNTICLPFDVKLSRIAEDAVAFAFTDYDGANNTLKFEKVETTLTAGVPYVIYVPAAINDAFTFKNVAITSPEASKSEHTMVFQGSYAPKSAGELTGCYGLTADGKIAKASAAATMKGFRGYFTNVPANARMAFNGFDVTTGISNVAADATAHEGIYNLQGQKMERLNKTGIYVINGKKVVIK